MATLSGTLIIQGQWCSVIEKDLGMASLDGESYRMTLAVLDACKHDLDKVQTEVINVDKLVKEVLEQAMAT